MHVAVRLSRVAVDFLYYFECRAFFFFQDLVGLLFLSRTCPFLFFASAMMVFAIFLWLMASCHCMVIDVNATSVANGAGGGEPPRPPGDPVPVKGGLCDDVEDDGEETEEWEDPATNLHQLWQGGQIDLRPCQVRFGGCGCMTYLRKNMCINRNCVGILI